MFQDEYKFIKRRLILSNLIIHRILIEKNLEQNKNQKQINLRIFNT